MTKAIEARRRQSRQTYVTAQQMLRSAQPRMTNTTFANHHERLVDGGYVRLSALSERFVASSLGSPRAPRHRRAKEMLMLAALDGRFDNSGTVLDEHAAEPLPLYGELLQYLATDARRYSTDRLLDRCWIPESVAADWLRRALANDSVETKPRRPGPEPALRNRIAQEMKRDVLTERFSRKELERFTGEALAAQYGASRNTAVAARRLALSQLPGEL